MLAVKHEMKKHNIAFFIVPGSTQPLLGRAAHEKLELANSNVSSEYETLLTEFSDVFKGLGNLPGEHKIVIDESVTPVAHACRKVPFKLHDKLKEELDRMEKLKVIAKVDEPTDWVSSMVIVKKENWQY